MTANNNYAQLERRPAMSLLSGRGDMYSHTCRIVLLEKDIDSIVEFVDVQEDAARIGEYNPYGELPTIIDRDVAIYNMNVMLEYLDERFPHPPLMPVDPIMRAKTRLTIMRLTRDWFDPIQALGDNGIYKISAELRKEIRDGLIALAPLFAENTWFMGEEFSLVDAYLGPLLWRLQVIGVELPEKSAEKLDKYAKRLFERKAFRKSLTEKELEMRE